MDQQKPFIVVVDDDDEDRYLLHCCFTELGLDENVKFFGDSQQFMKYAELLSSVNIKPSLIILDYEMPYANGRALLEYLKSHTALQDIPVVILSSQLPEDTKGKLRALGVTASYQKGINLPEIVTEMQEIIKYASPAESK